MRTVVRTAGRVAQIASKAAASVVASATPSPLSSLIHPKEGGGLRSPRSEEEQVKVSHLFVVKVAAAAVVVIAGTRPPQCRTRIRVIDAFQSPETLFTTGNATSVPPHATPSFDWVDRCPRTDTRERVSALALLLCPSRFRAALESSSGSGFVSGRPPHHRLVRRCTHSAVDLAVSSWCASGALSGRARNRRGLSLTPWCQWRYGVRRVPQ